MNQEQNIKQDDTIRIGKKLKVEFTSITHDGMGICKINGINSKGEEYNNFPIFVLGALPKEEGIIEIEKLHSSYGYGKLLKVFPDKTSKYRTKPICPNYPDCGGCNIMHMNYEGQLEFKRGLVKDTFKKIAGMEKVIVKDVIGMNNPYYYRNKVQVPFAQNMGKNTCGFYRRNTHEIIPLQQCYIQPEESTEVVKFVKNLCNEMKYKGYDEKKHTGDIRHIVVKTTKNQQQIMVVLISMRKDLPNIDILCQKLVKRFPHVTSVVINVNDKKGNGIIGNSSFVVYGENKIIDELCGLKFELSAESFFQVNHQQTEKLYQQAIEVANLNESDIVIDAYCGIGTIGLIASKHVKHVYGVEIVEDAVKNAKNNAKLNKIKNVTFECNKAEDQIIKWQKTVPATTIFVDPPRKGCDETLLKTIIEMNIPKVVYVSCDPATLARDVKILSEYYDLKTVQPVDMFPQSSHIENVACLIRKKSN